MRGFVLASVQNNFRTYRLVERLMDGVGYREAQ